MTAPLFAGPSSTAVSEHAERPTETLPTERVKFEKQLDLLRAYAAVSGPSSRIVTTTDVANVAKLNPSTVSLCNGFYVDVGFIERTPTGFVPSPTVFAFQRAYQWNPATAAHKLAPNLRGSWFYQRLLPRLEMGVLSETDAVLVLADAANAHKRYESQLHLLLDYLEAAGLVRREGEMLRMATPSNEPETTRVTSVTFTPAESDARPAPQAAATVVASPVTHAMNFSIDVSVDMTEIASWSPDRITAFFSGVAQVLAAKAGVDAKGKTL